MDAQLVKKLHDNHIAAWNERDRGKRDELLRKVFGKHQNVRS
jgi:hypothetical protein